MSFFAGRIEETAGTRIVRDLHPVKLQGSDGLIRRHVSSLAPEATISWSLRGEQLARLAGPALFFRIAPGEADPRAAVYEIHALNGVTLSKRSELFLDFTASPCEMKADGTWVLPLLSGREPQLREVLALSGGTRGGDWKWTQPIVQLGAAVLQ